MPFSRSRVLLSAFSLALTTTIFALAPATGSALAQGSNRASKPTDHRRAGPAEKRTSERTYLSPWTPASNKTSGAIRIEHTLGYVPTELFVWFSPTAAGTEVYPIVSNHAVSNAGNPVTIAVDKNAVTLNIVSGTALYSPWSSEEGWHPYTEGFFRIKVK